VIEQTLAEVAETVREFKLLRDWTRQSPSFVGRLDGTARPAGRACLCELQRELAENREGFEPKQYNRLGLLRLAGRALAVGSANAVFLQPTAHRHGQ
jgi:hypothetical protein